jgi:hypothetical protein
MLCAPRLGSHVQHGESLSVGEQGVRAVVELALHALQ